MAADYYGNIYIIVRFMELHKKPIAKVPNATDQPLKVFFERSPHGGRNREVS